MNHIVFKPDGTCWVKGSSGAELGFTINKKDPNGSIILISKINNKEIREIVSKKNMPKIIEEAIDFYKNNGFGLNIENIGNKKVLNITPDKNKYPGEKTRHIVIGAADTEDKIRNINCVQSLFNFIKNSNENEKKIAQILIPLMMMSALAGGLTYGVINSIKDNGITIEQVEAKSIKTELIDKAINNFEILGIANELKNGKVNDDYGFSKLRLVDPDPLAVWAYYEAIPKLCGTNFVEKENAYNQFIKSICYHNENANYEIYNYLSIQQYYKNNRFVDNDDEPSKQAFDSYIEKRINDINNYGIEPISRIFNINTEHSNSNDIKTYIRKV